MEFPWNSMESSICEIFHGNIMGFNVEYSVEFPRNSTEFRGNFMEYSAWNPMEFLWEISHVK